MLRLTAISAKKILRDLKKMRKLGIYPIDVVVRNYKAGGLLINFSIAITKPHCLFVIKPGWWMEMQKMYDLHSFESMMEDEGVVMWERAVPNSKYCKKLRSYDSEKGQRCM